MALRESAERPHLRPERGPSALSGPGRAGRVILNKYCVLDSLGTGGMGEVYEVEHMVLGRRFAAKLMRSELMREPSTSERFFREARAMAMVQSDHVASIVDVGTLDDGTPVIVMERLFGEDLRALLRREGPLPVARAVRLILDAAWGLHSVHEAGLVHRDVKPANLFVVRRDCGEELCKLLDFGVAKSPAAASTQQGTLVGTLSYMAPEQLRDGTAVDERTDIYALGAVLFESLAGSPPHTGDTPERVMFSIMNQEPVPLRSLRADVAPALCDLVMRALARDPSRRFDTVEQMAASLLPYSGLGPAHDTGDPARFATTLRAPYAALGAARRPSRWALLGSGLVGVATGAGLVSGVTLLVPRAQEPARHSDVSHAPAAVPPRADGAGSTASPQASRDAAGEAATPRRAAPASRTAPLANAADSRRVEHAAPARSRVETVTHAPAGQGWSAMSHTAAMDTIPVVPWLEADNPYGKNPR
jgi:eukaryotic-like serine/threonine-protein kinase